MNQMMADGSLNAAQVLGVNTAGGVTGLQAVMDSDEDGMGEAIQVNEPKRGKVVKKGKKKNASVTGSVNSQMMGRKVVTNNYM